MALGQPDELRPCARRAHCPARIGNCFETDHRRGQGCNLCRCRLGAAALSEGTGTTPRIRAKSSRLSSTVATSDESPDPTSPSRERLPLPEGTIPVGVALLIAGVATYAFFKIGNVAVGGDEAFAPITSLWFATFALAPGFFLPLEQ